MICKFTAIRRLGADEPAPCNAEVFVRHQKIARVVVPHDKSSAVAMVITSKGEKGFVMVHDEAMKLVSQMMLAEQIGRANV